MNVDSKTGARWIGLGEASAMLGIAPPTLRRWADDGRIPVFTTPGGHRRFSRAAITALLPADRAHRPTLARLGASPERIARSYRGLHGAGDPAHASWIDGLSPERRIIFRDRGRELVAVLLVYLDAPDAAAAKVRLQDAKRLAAAYGREVAELGWSMTEAVESFLQFRAPFTEALAAVARRRGLDTREATDLLSDAEAATDSLLVALVTGHSLAAGERDVSRARSQALSAE